MVYLNNNTELQEVWIPKNDGTGSTHKPTYELESVNVSISADTTTVTPSSGYYGMSAVTIDASEYGQSNYDEGFDDGYTDGYSSGTSDGEQSVIDTFTSTTITINGQYGSSANPYSSVTVNVAQTGHTDEELQEAYESGYTSGSTDGYNSGYTSGETHQKSLLVSTAFTQNGTYTRENGWSGVTVKIDTASTYNSGYTSGYTSGHTDGVDEEKAKMSAVTFTANTAVTLSDGSYSAVTVNVPQTGSTAVLGVGSFSANGTYFSSTDNLDGYSAITVNVPQSGSSKVISLVDYVHTDILSDDANDKYLDTGIIPTTATTFRVQGMTKGYGQGNAIVGYTYNDSEDYRLFWWNWYYTGSHLTFDFNNQRIDNSWGGSYDGRIVDITCSNYQAVSGNGTTLMSGTTQTTIDDPHTILIDVGSWWAKSLEIWDNGVKVFDGQAAVDSDGNIGLYDAVSMSMVYNSGLTMAYEGTPTPIPSQDYQSGYTDGQNSIISTFTAMTATTNGVYGSSAHPLSSITVNVPQSGSSDADLVAMITRDTGFTYINVPSACTRIGNGAFYDSPITGITIPDTVTYIGFESFMMCRIRNIYIPDTVTTIEDGAFSYSSLRTIRLSNSLTVINDDMFKQCVYLTGLTIPASVTLLGGEILYGCINLTEINCLCTTPPSKNFDSGDSNWETFANIPSSGTFHYPAGSDYSSWQNDSNLSGWTFIGDL